MTIQPLSESETVAKCRIQPAKYDLKIVRQPSESEKLELLKCDWTFPRSYIFPATAIRGVSRRFNNIWLEKSETDDGVFCNWCMLFEGSDTLFVKASVGDWGNLGKYIYNIRTLSVNIKFICTSFRNRQNSEHSASFSGLFSSEYKRILYLTAMYVYCVYPAMSKKSENLSDLNKKDRNKRHSSPFINVVKGVFFVVRVTLIPVSYLSAPSAVHSYRVPGKFIRRLKSLFV